MVERKIIPSTRGYRIVNYNYMTRIGFNKTQTVVVRVPNSRHRTFETALVATEGIQGQPQLTFDSWRAARDWLDSHEEYNHVCSISTTRSTYDCVKIPLADGSEGWLSVSMLHPGSDYWEWLGELYPAYFREEPPEPQQPVLRGGWFTEDLHVEEQDWREVYKIGNAYGQRGIVRIPRVRTDTFTWSFVDGLMTQYRDIVFFSEQEATAWLESHRNMIDLPWRIIRNRSNYETWRTFIKVPLSDGSVVHVSTWGIPKDPDATEGPFSTYYFPQQGETADWCRQWWEKVRHLYPDYFGTGSENVHTPESEEEPEQPNSQFRGGWFNETLGIKERIYYNPQIILSQGDRFVTNTEEVLESIINANPQEIIWFAPDTEYEIVDCSDHDDVTLSYSPVDGPLYLGGTLDGESFDDIQHLVNIPGVITYFNGDRIEEVVDDEEHDEPKESEQPKSQFSGGWFNEEVEERKTDMIINEAYRSQPEDIKKVVLLYVLQNGYTPGYWNGRYSTGSPTVAEINRLLRANEYQPYLPTETDEIRKWEQFKSWADQITPEQLSQNMSSRSDWANKVVASWGKTEPLDIDDVKNLASLVSYWQGSIRHQERELARQERERQHQAAVAAATNTWAGQVGDQVEFVIAEVQEREGLYGSFYTGKGTDGRAYSWTQTESQILPEVGDTITGKIKKLNEFRGIKQTHLVRVTVVAGPDHGRNSDHENTFDDSKPETGFKGGWFNEDINNKEDEEWLLDTFGIDLLTLKRLLGYNEADWHITFESEKGYTVFNILKKDTEEGDITLGQAVEWYGYDQVFDFIYRLLNEAYDQKILL